LHRITPPKVHQIQSRAALQLLAIKQMRLTAAVANQAAAENLEADLYLVAAVENPQVLIKEMEKLMVLDRALDRDLDHHPQAESL
jgi:hypothetical protein